MIAKSPDERRYYQSRLKMQRDEQARLEAAEERGEARGRAEGRAEGEAIGEVIGRIRLLESLLEMPESSLEELRSRTIGELAGVEAALQRQLRERG